MVTAKVVPELYREDGHRVHDGVQIYGGSNTFIIQDSSFMIASFFATISLIFNNSWELAGKTR
jgi:hypothetical protein